MKKFLSIMLSILMVVTMIPFTPLAQAADTVTLYLKNTAGWQSTMYAYCWKENDSVRPLGSWPGTLMDKLEGESELYAIDVPADTYAIIFNDGANQTEDLFLPTDGSNYYNNATGEWTTISTRGHDHALTADGEVLEFTTLPADTTRIDTAGNYYLTQDMELTNNLWIDVEGTVNLCLNGHSITAVEDNSNQTVVFLYGGTLNLCDCKGGGCITSAEGLTSNGVRTFGDTEFNMYSGEIKNNYYYAVNCVDFNMYGGKLSGNKWGAVYASGIFNMYGGEISGNSGMFGAVRVDNNGSFTMYDGEIKDNINKSGNWNSGNVYVEDATFTMKGGKIIGNTGGAGSGGVYAGGKFVMEGGEISGNSGNNGGVFVNTGTSFTMNGGVIKNNTASADGGGVWLNQNASFTMNGGEISGNTAKEGGGVYSSFDSAKINLKKGLITNNTATESVGGVGSYYGNTPVIISGADVQIMNNTAPTYPDLRVNAPVTVSAPLDSAKTKISLSVNGEIIAKPDGTNLTTLEGMEDCFVLSNEERFVMCNKNGELLATELYAYITEKDGDLVVNVPDNDSVTYQWYEVNGDELTELEGETSDKLTRDKVVIGKTYACQVYLEGEEMELLKIKCSYAITHQPTLEEPYVELNDDTDASYQWYTVEGEMKEVVDDGKTGSYYDESYYDEETGWNGDWWGADGADYFYVYLKQGQKITIVPSAYCEEIGIYDFETDEYGDCGECEAGDKFTYVAEVNGWYYVYAYSDYYDETTLRAYIGEVTYTELEGKTSAELKSIPFGNKYSCEVTFGDGTTEMSDVIDLSYKITHQPTEKEPYVELNNDTDAAYQWYEIEKNPEEITDENADGSWSTFGAPADIYGTYGENGWSSSSGYYFVVQLKAGDTVAFELSEEYGELRYMYTDTPGGMGDTGPVAMDGTKASFTAGADGYYGFFEYDGEPRIVKAYFVELTYTEIEGETSAELKNLESGTSYACEVTFGNGKTEMTDEFEYKYVITHQPTVAEPYVELNNYTDVTYQWYTVECNYAEITDENADTVAYDWGESFYSEETGWTGVPYEEDYYGQDFFTVELEEGETVTVELTGDFTDSLGLYDYDKNEDVWADVEEGVTTYELTVPSAGNYTFYAYVNSGAGTVKAYKEESANSKIEGETSAELKNPEIGTKYACEVTFADDTTEMSDVFEYKYAITHQPTEAEPYVETNDSQATYQWYIVEGDISEVTDKNATVFDPDDLDLPAGLVATKASYKASTGWTPATINMSEGFAQYYFFVEMKAGEKINFEFSSAPLFVMFAPLESDDVDPLDLDGKKASFTATENGNYCLAAMGPSVVTVKASTGDASYTEVEGQTSATLTPTALGKYACEATFVDGTTEMSDLFEVTTLHDCDFSGEWKYDADKHWKECTADGCGKISEEAEHSFTDSKCDCGYTCPHSSYTDGVCDKCDYECPHSWGEGVLTRPTFETTGYYTYTCTLCGNSYTEPAKKADSTALNDASMKVTEYIDNDTLTQEAKDEIYKSYRDILKNNGNIFDELGFVRNDLVEEDQPAIDAITEELQNIIDEAEEKIASGEYVKADYTEINRAIKEIEDKFFYEDVTDEGKAGLEEIKKQLAEMKADENTSKADLAELEKELEAYEEELDKGIEDGTLVRVRPEKIGTEFSDKWKERLEAEGLTDEFEDFVNNQKATDEALAAEKEIIDLMTSLEGTVAENAENIAKLNEMVGSFYASVENCLRGTHNFNDYEVTSPAKCEVNAIETRTCWFCGETDEREIEGTALKHSYTKYEVTEEAECGKAGKEVAYCDHGCQTTDEREIPALEHIFLDYVSNGDATCTADGTKTAECINGCGATDTVEDEDSMLDHADEDGDKICDDCEAEIVDVCPDCGRPVHAEKGIPQYICLIITLIKLVVSFVKAVQGVAA